MLTRFRAFSSFVIFLSLTLAFSGCKKKDGLSRGNDGQLSEKPQQRYDLDSTQINAFFKSHPDFARFRKDIDSLYNKSQNRMVWYDKDGRIQFADVLYDRAYQLGEEGLPLDIPYRAEIDDVFQKHDRSKPTTEDELLVSSLYFYYTFTVFNGKLGAKEVRAIGWYLPKQNTSFVNYLDLLSKDPKLLDEDLNENYSQYYHLRDGLKRYREIAKKGGWAKIALPKGFKELKPGADDPVVAAVRKRFAVTGEIASDNGKTLFDDDLEKAIVTYNTRLGRPTENTITEKLVGELNVPVQTCIRKIAINMERCRWVSPGIDKAQDYIAVNIPSYKLRYVKDGKIALESPVVVGKEFHETVIFSGKMSYIVFSPYWNVPPNIIEKEIKPGMAKNPNYLANHRMEWNNGHVRQLPGADNSLGLVKFMFPNNNNIYLHDTPAKALFNKDERAFSHGCVRVGKPVELANMILKDDPNWTPAKISQAMHAGKESTYSLKKKIPVYIAYFTAWADEKGNVAFFDDVYKRDDRLAAALFK